MPIYEYECQKCHHQLEKLQKVSDPALVDCPDCGKPALQKMISQAGFRLKGTGWYETDFKNKDKKPAASADKPASASSADVKPQTHKSDQSADTASPAIEKSASAPSKTTTTDKD